MAKPEKVFKVGACQAAIFVNEVEKDGKVMTLPKVSLQVRFRDKRGEWKGTSSLSVNDLPKAILALQKAYDYLTSREKHRTSELALEK